jgi:amphiphysin
MNTVHRQYAKVLHKGGEDDAKVTVLLQEYNDADKVLEKVR